MIISVLERRREIGLRRALGANRGQIRSQFLVEAVILSSLGGLAGALLGTLATLGYATHQAWPPVIPLNSLAEGIGGAFLVGIVAGVYPSIRASRLTPPKHSPLPDIRDRSHRGEARSVMALAPFGPEQRDCRSCIRNQSLRRDQKRPVLQREAPRPSLADRIRTLAAQYGHQPQRSTVTSLPNRRGLSPVNGTALSASPLGAALAATSCHPGERSTACPRRRGHRRSGV